MDIDSILNELYNKYYDYYNSVYIEYIKEAIINTMQDLKHVKNITIDDIHNNIKENYI
jgi:hypothetical protein